MLQKSNGFSTLGAKTRNVNIIFYGTPDFAVASLRGLVEANKKVVAVVTAPDRPAGRGYKLKASAVKDYALSQNLPVLQPTNLKSEAFQQKLSEYQPDLQIIVAFRMLPEKVWSFPPKGTFNLHASLLPRYRGAAPINWAVIKGEKKTGVTTFFLQHEIDTGEILLQKETAIGENETAGEVHDRLMHMGSELVLETVEAIEEGKNEGTPQATFIEKGIEPCPAPKLTKKTGAINLAAPIKEIHQLILGLSPFPGAYVYIRKGEQQKHIKLFRSENPVTKESAHEPYFHVEENELHLHTPQGRLTVTQLQLEGKKRMNATDFVKGFPISDWNVISLT